MTAQTNVTDNLLALDDATPLTVCQTASVLQVDEDTVSKMLKRGTLPYLDLGPRTRRVLVGDLRALLTNGAQRRVAEDAAVNTPTVRKAVNPKHAVLIPTTLKTR